MTRLVVRLALLLVLSLPATANEYVIMAAGQSNMLKPELHQAFVERMAENGHTVQLLPCAVGGSSILWWGRRWIRQPLYGECLQQAMEAGRVDGMIWWQGEADTQKTDVWQNGYQWAALFAEFIANMRADTGCNFPVAYARLNEVRQQEGWVAIRTQQELFSGPGTVMVSTDGVEWEGNAIHATYAAYRTIGRRFADALLKIQLEHSE